MRFYYGSGSPWAWRVHLALEEKRLPYEAVLLSFQSGDLKTPEYLKVSPHGKVPALVDGEVALYESQPILEYLEERHPAPPLLPHDPAARALARIEETEATIYFFEAFGGIGRHVFFTPPDKRDPAKVAEARARTRAELDRLEVRAADRDAAFLIGSALTRVDTTWLPFVELAVRGGVELDGLPWIAAWRERMRARPSFDATYPPHWRTSPRPA
jgi:glutathione S-transferase